jgi:membrane protease YdiL (CAAX protease family)
MVLLALVLVSHVAHRDRPAAMGLTLDGLRASAQAVLPLALALFLPAVIYGFAHRDLLLLPPGGAVLTSFATYGVWCIFQQYLMQSYFHHRLMSVSDNRHLTSALVALMFGAAHLPNPILTVVTALGGFLLAEIFARHRNIFALAFAQTVGGFLVAALSPASLIHGMRVGPGYFFFDLR